MQPLKTQIDPRSEEFRANARAMRVPGVIAPERVADVAARLHDLGSYEISLGDTIGAGRPPSVLRMLEAVSRKVPVEQLAGHFHDTFGMAIANVHASCLFGLRTFDGWVSGLGGCPYAAGATGNVATEDLIYPARVRTRSPQEAPGHVCVDALIC